MGIDNQKKLYKSEKDYSPHLHLMIIDIGWVVKNSWENIDNYKGKNRDINNIFFMIWFKNNFSPKQ